VPATFFIITGHVPGNERLLARMVAEGHEIGNHLTRDEPSIRLPRAEFARELEHAHELLGRYAVPTWFRPGSGRFDQHMLATVAARGYRLALGSVYPYDPHVHSSWFASRYILWAMHPGAVIVLHDVGGRGRRTLATLSRVLPELKRQGYRFVTLSRLAARETASPRRPPAEPPATRSGPGRDALDGRACPWPSPGASSAERRS
jgi:peptidoglycan/xylan/chitin deacetylase (PgdA/CDA1 family)